MQLNRSDKVLIHYSNGSDNIFPAEFSVASIMNGAECVVLDNNFNIPMVSVGYHFEKRFRNNFTVNLPPPVISRWVDEFGDKYLGFFKPDDEKGIITNIVYQHLAELFGCVAILVNE